MLRTDYRRSPSSGLDAFDYFVLAGASVNLVVIACLVGYWLFA